MEQPEIAEAAVVGEPDRVRGEIPVAYIVAAGQPVRSRVARSRAAAKSWPRSRSRAGSRWSKSCRATRWGKCRNISCAAHPDGGLRGRAVRQDRRPGRCAGLPARRAGAPGRSKWPSCCRAIAAFRLPPGGPILTTAASRSGPHGYTVAIHEIVRHGVRYLFADCPPLYDRAGIYGERQRRLPRQSHPLRRSYTRPRSEWPARFSAPMFFTRTIGRPACCRSIFARSSRSTRRFSAFAACSPSTT